MKKAALLIFNLLAFITLTAVLCILWWHLFGKSYIFTSEPVGGDYFNAITYVKFFKDSLPLPPQGWVNIWFEGMPVVGGYPWLSFYLIQPLTNYFDVATSMEVFSAITLLLLFLGSFILLWQVSKNVFLAFALTLVMVGTRATYYALTTGGFIASFTSHYFLPFSLFFLYKFNEQRKSKYLVASAICTGISLLYHAPTAVLTIFLPSLAVLTFLPPIRTDFKKKLKNIGIFLLVALTTGAMGFYNVLLQNFLGSGTDACQSPQCWGIYPQHLIVWMNAISPALIGFFLALLLLIKIFKRSVKFPIILILPALSGLFVVFLYDLLAYLKLINGMANVFFPTRTFWAVNLFLLLIVASLFSSFSKALPKFSFLLAGIVAVSITYFVYTNFPPIHRYFSDTVPMDAHAYTIPKYQKKDLSELVPNWIPKEDKNWRIDTFNPGLTHWWNFVYDIPSTRGYSNYPLGIHRDWVYFLQVATMDPKDENAELVKNRAMFVLDGFGIRYHENSFASYPKSIIEDRNIVEEVGERYRDFTWYKFSDNVVSPIVYPTKSSAVLFIGDDNGYENFIRSIAMTNLNSFAFTPVKGPSSIDALSQEELKNFDSLILYRFKGSNWSKLISFVKDGGKIYIDTASFDKSVNNLPEIFPINNLKVTTVNGKWDASLSPTQTKLTNNLNLDNFSPLSFEGKEWRITGSDPSDVRSWAKPILTRDNVLLLAEGDLGKGKVVWSSVNLPFHIVDNDNYDEAKLFGNILNSFVIKVDPNTDFKVERPKPEEIKINASNIKGIYFKENYDSGWQFFAGAEKLKVYKAGLEFMYAPIPEELQNNKSFTILYRGSFINWFLFILTIIAFFFALFYIFIPRPLRFLTNILYTQFKKRVGKRISSWIEEE